MGLTLIGHVHENAGSISNAKETDFGRRGVGSNGECQYVGECRDCDSWPSLDKHLKVVSSGLTSLLAPVSGINFDVCHQHHCWKFHVHEFLISYLSRRMEIQSYSRLRVKKHRMGWMVCRVVDCNHFLRLKLVGRHSQPSFS